MAMRSNRQIGSAVSVGLVLFVLGVMFGSGARGNGGQSQELDRTFTLHEVSAFDPRERPPESLFGDIILCRNTPDANVVAYPTFRSDHPLYAKARFPAPREGPGKTTFYYLAIDESGGTGHGYDRLYFDLNHDGNLTNDKPLPTREDPMKAVALSSRQTVCFETLAIPLPFGAQEWRAVELLPRLVLSAEGPSFLGLLATKARQGVIRIGARDYLVWLSHGFTIVGWFDHPQTAMHLAPVENGRRPLSWRNGGLAATRNIDGTFYRFSAAPAGDKLTVHPYTGPLGTLETRLGDKAVNRILVTGSLRAPTTTVPVAMTKSGGDVADPSRFCKLPVGDYQIGYLDAQFDDLSFIVAGNRGPGNESKDQYGIAIRADKPFVLDFVGQPQVHFIAPATDHRLKPGQELRVTAWLVDPSLGILFRRLALDGKLLNPKVTITRAGGEVVAQGLMPFG